MGGRCSFAGGKLQGEAPTGLEFSTMANKAAIFAILFCVGSRRTLGRLKVFAKPGGALVLMLHKAQSCPI